MRQAVIPFLLYILLQGVVFLAGASVMPARIRNRPDGTALLRAYVFGQMLIWALIELLAVPAIQLRLPFSTVFVAFLAALAALVAAGLYRLWRARKHISPPSPRRFFKSLSRLGAILLVAVLLLVALQFFAYFFGQHLDEDDARWLAEANDALESGQMMLRNPSTGEYMGSFGAVQEVVKDVVSPWAIFFAILARLFNLSSAIIAHSFYAPVALLMCYCVYALMARELFAGTESRLTFVLSVALINLFYAGAVYTQGAFSLVRIWQGKATVAAIVIPLLLYLFICVNRRNETSDWVMLIVCGVGSCLMSGMGVSMAGIMIGVYGAYDIVAYRRWNRIGLWAASIAPVAVVALSYFYLRG